MMVAISCIMYEKSYNVRQLHDIRVIENVPAYPGTGLAACAQAKARVFEREALAITLDVIEEDI